LNRYRPEIHCSSGFTHDFPIGFMTPFALPARPHRPMSLDFFARMTGHGAPSVGHATTDGKITG
jgi:hypothetical protein